MKWFRQTEPGREYPGRKGSREMEISKEVANFIRGSFRPNCPNEMRGDKTKECSQCPLDKTCMEALRVIRKLQGIGK